MYDLQGFINIGPLKDNTPGGVTAPVGELSEYATSFAKDKQWFSKANMQVELVAFTSKRGKVAITVPSSFSDNVLTVTQWIYSQAINGVLKNDEVEFQRLLVGQFSSKISKVSTGAMIEGKGNWFPRWIAYTLEGQEENEIRLWFSDADFAKDYRGFDIEVILMLNPIDTFQSVKTVVEKALEEWNLPDHHDKVNEMANKFPYTAIHTNYYTWHDREDSESTIPNIVFTCIIYGPQGRNPTYVKEAYQNAVLSQSGYGRADWAKVFPDLFSTTRFTFIPGWQIRGIPNMEDIASLYSPILPYDFILKSIDTFGKWSATESDTTIPHKVPATDVCLVPAQYKSLSAVCISGPENADNKKTLHETIPDYALISTSSSEISRVSKPTTEWIRLYIQALIAAEEYHPYAGTTDVVKVIDENNKDLAFYIFEHENVEYRVLSRTSVWPKVV